MLEWPLHPDLSSIIEDSCWSIVPNVQAIFGCGCEPYKMFTDVIWCHDQPRNPGSNFQRLSNLLLSLHESNASFIRLIGWDSFLILKMLSCWVSDARIGLWSLVAVGFTQLATTSPPCETSPWMPRRFPGKHFCPAHNANRSVVDILRSAPRCPISRSRSCCLSVVKLNMEDATISAKEQDSKRF